MMLDITKSPTLSKSQFSIVKYINNVMFWNVCNLKGNLSDRDNLWTKDKIHALNVYIHVALMSEQTIFLVKFEDTKESILMPLSP